MALDAIVESEEKIKGLNKKIGNVENRLDNIEKKVSDELPDILTKQLLEETDKRYFRVYPGFPTLFWGLSGFFWVFRG